MKVIDVFTFNGEYDLLEIRLNILSDYVDEFIIVEFPETFSGKQKPLYYEEQKKRYSKWADKIKYVVPTLYKEKYMALANGSPNTDYGKGAKHWLTEFCQKESIKEALTHLNDDDIVFVGDVDEIWDKDALAWSHAPFKLELAVYAYYLNNRSSEKFYGTLISPYREIRLSCLNHLRTTAWKTAGVLGWHFTSMGGYEAVKTKLEDSYTAESYWTPEIAANLQKNVENGVDFLGRGFSYSLSDVDLPKYLLDNRDKYAHLFKS